jgi:hypothetical protein
MLVPPFLVEPVVHVENDEIRYTVDIRGYLRIKYAHMRQECTVSTTLLRWRGGVATLCRLVLYCGALYIYCNTDSGS